MGKEIAEERRVAGQQGIQIQGATNCGQVCQLDLPWRQSTPFLAGNAKRWVRALI
jgi:hypothetical protein